MGKEVYEAKITFKMTLVKTLDIDTKKFMDDAIKELLENNIDREEAEYEIIVESTVEDI